MREDNQKITIEYICYINTSGYSSAAKGYVLLLEDMGYNIILRPHGPAYLDKRSEVDNSIDKLINKKVTSKPDITFVHLVPPLGTEYLSRGIPTVFLYAWEGQCLPKVFKDTLAMPSHCITFVNQQVEVYRKDMGKTNISCIPHVIFNNPVYKVPDRHQKKDGDIYAFLSVFEWVERKDPATLLKAYLHEFNILDY